MSRERFTKYASTIETFVANVVLDRARAKNLNNTITLRQSTKTEDRELKCDFFLLKDGAEYMAYDAKAPTGIDGPNVNFDKFWFCPYDGNGDEKDISTIVKIKIKTIKNRYIAFLSSGDIFLVSAERLAEWASKNCNPDFYEWKNGNRDLFRNTPRAEFGTFWIHENNGFEKILTFLSVKDLEAMGSYRICLTNSEAHELQHIIESMHDNRRT